MEKRLLSIVIIIFLLLSASIPSVSSYSKAVNIESSSKIKLERRFFFAEVFGKINVKDTYSVKKIFSELSLKVIVNGTAVSDI